MSHSGKTFCRSGGAALKGPTKHDRQCARSSLANAVTAILLQADIIRRQIASDVLDEHEVQIATEQIDLNAKRIWSVVEAAVLKPL